MAASAIKLYSDLVISSKIGVDSKGKAITKKSNLGKLVPGAKDQDLFDVVKAVEKVMHNPVDDIQKIEHSIIVNE